MLYVGKTFKAKVGTHKLYVRAEEDVDGKIKSVFIDAHDAGPTIRGILNCLSEAVNVGLAAGVPLEKYVDKFLFTRFSPNGNVTGTDFVKVTTSVVDLAFRALAIHYLGRDDLKQTE